MDPATITAIALGAAAAAIASIIKSVSDWIRRGNQSYTISVDDKKITVSAGNLTKKQISQIIDALSATEGGDGDDE